MFLTKFSNSTGLLFGDVILGGYRPHCVGERTEREQTAKQELNNQPSEDGKCAVDFSAGEEVEKSDVENAETKSVALIEKRKIFFDRPDDSYENFFDLAKESNKTGISYRSYADNNDYILR